MVVEHFFSDSISVTDSIIVDSGATTSFADAVSVTDTVVVEASRLVLVSDAVTISDTTATSAERSVLVTDTAFATDTVSLNLLTLSDALDVSDVTIVDVQAAFSDHVTIDDAVATEIQVSRTLADAVLVTDKLSPEFDKSVPDASAGPFQYHDWIDVTDSVVCDRILGADLADTLLITDDVQRGYIRRVDVSDLLAYSDTSVFDVTLGRTLTDIVTLTDYLNVNTGVIELMFSDTIALTERTRTEYIPTQEVEGVADNRDFYMPVGNTGIVFVAEIPGAWGGTGFQYSNRGIKAAMLRAGSTLAQWGLKGGAVFAFLRTAAYMNQSAVAVMLGVDLSTVQAWEADQLEIPRLCHLAISTLVCQKDQRSAPVDQELHPPESREAVGREIRVFPAVPKAVKPRVIR
jgi:hypothetical protein